VRDIGSLLFPVRFLPVHVQQLPSLHSLVDGKLEQSHLLGNDLEDILLRVLGEAPAEVDVSAAGLLPLGGIPREVLDQVRLCNIDGIHTDKCRWLSGDCKSEQVTSYTVAIDIYTNIYCQRFCTGKVIVLWIVEGKLLTSRWYI
jgi:hypothetical protein